MPATPLVPAMPITPVDWVQIVAICTLGFMVVNFLLQRVKDLGKTHRKDKKLAVRLALMEHRIKHLERSER